MQIHCFLDFNSRATALLNLIFLACGRHLFREADIVESLLKIRKIWDMKRKVKKLLLILSLCGGFNMACFADEKNTEQELERARQAYQAKDYELARQTFKPLAKAGDSKAQIYMGTIYDSGLGVQRDINQALYWFEQSAEQGDIKLQYDLGTRYLNGKGVERDYGKAFYWWKKAADAGSYQAQYNLALMNTRGDGVPLDYGEACRLFELSAKQGYPSAQYNLAVLTESGKGTAVNINEAIAWYRKAAEQGHERAKERLVQLEAQSVTAPATQVIYDLKWIKNQPATNYTIQINLSDDKGTLVRWLTSQQSLAPLAYFPQQQNGKVVYKAIYGSFVDQAAAQKALSEMPEELVKLKPWLRRFSGVPKQIAVE